MSSAHADRIGFARKDGRDPAFRQGFPYLWPPAIVGRVHGTAILEFSTMSHPLGTIGALYGHGIQPAIEHSADVGGKVVKATGDVGHAVSQAAKEVGHDVAQEGYGKVATDIVKHDVATDVGILKEMHARSNSPMDFVDWLAGPQGPSVEGATAQVPGLQSAIGHVIDAAMDNPLIASVAGKVFSFEKVPGQDFYTTNESGLQSVAGFHGAMDNGRQADGHGSAGQDDGVHRQRRRLPSGIVER